MTNKINEMMDCFINQTKVKIIGGIEMLEQATAKQLMEMYKDIPQATLYRALNKLAELEIIEVAEEHPKRGTVEKVYTLNKKTDLLDAGRVVKENDGSGFTASPICATQDELQELGYKLAEVIEPYRKNPPAENRKNHTMALIFTPPGE